MFTENMSRKEKAKNLDFRDRGREWGRGDNRQPSLQLDRIQQ